MNVDLMATIAAIQHQTASAGIADITYRFLGQDGFERFIASGLPDPGMVGDGT